MTCLCASRPARLSVLLAGYDMLVLHHSFARRLTWLLELLVTVGLCSVVCADWATGLERRAIVGVVGMLCVIVSMRQLWLERVVWFPLVVTSDSIAQKAIRVNLDANTRFRFTGLRTTHGRPRRAFFVVVCDDAARVMFHPPSLRPRPAAEELPPLLEEVWKAYGLIP